jgi:hypothetical protein
MVGKAQKSHGERSELYGGCSYGVPLIHFCQGEHRIQFRSRPMRFLGFSNHEKGAPRQEISKCSTVCSTFSRSGWSVVRSTSLAKGGSSKKETVTAPPQSSNRSSKVSPRTYLRNASLKHYSTCLAACLHNKVNSHSSET